MNNNIFYLPISSSSLPHYLASACIKPAVYFTNKPKDIQDSAACHLLLTSYKGYRDASCCLELELLPEETHRLISAGEGWYLFDLMLPFSRVRRILFSDAEKMNNSFANIELSTAFVPKNVMKVVREFEGETAPKIPMAPPVTNLSRQIDLYDRLLGAFMLMKTVYEEGYVPDAYFGLLGLVCRKVETEAKAALGKGYTEKYRPLLDRNERDPKIKLLSSEITDEVVVNEAKAEGQRVEYDPLTKLMKLDNLDRQTYVIAILNMYGVGNEARRKKVDELVLSGFTQGIKSDKSELVATYYGYNRGYSVFPKQYVSRQKGIVKDTKFRFASRLDYYTVESVYRYVLTGNASTDFAGFESWWTGKFVQAGRKRILDYTVMPMPTKVAKEQAVSASVNNWVGEIAMRSAKSFDPTRSTVFSACLEAGQAVYAETMRRVSEQQRRTSAGLSPAVKLQLAERWMELSAMSTSQLKAVALKMGIANFKNMKKDALLKAIFTANENQPKQ